MASTFKGSLIKCSIALVCFLVFLEKMLDKPWCINLVLKNQFLDNKFVVKKPQHVCLYILSAERLVKD